MISSILSKSSEIGHNPYTNCLNKNVKKDQVYFCTVQKSGTNLLIKILQLFEIETGFHSGHKHLCEKKNAIDRGAKFSQAFNSNKKCYILYRDPRDCVISQIFHKKRGNGEDVKKLVDRPLLKKLTMDKLITKSLNYQKIPKDHVGSYARELFQSLALVRYLLKHPHPNRLLLRFEDLVPAFTGGADEQKRFATFRKICTFANKSASDEKIHEVMEKCWGETITFRESKQKKVGQWVNYFTSEHIKIFQKRFNPFLLELGYETDQNWHEKYLNPPIESKPIVHH